MWTLSPLENIDEQKIIDTALTYKNGDIKYELSDAEKISITEIYELYDQLEGREHNDLKGLGTLSQESRSAMHDAYGEIQIKGRLSNYRSKILLSAKRCPCCSIIDADEVDHYLPRSIFNALSLYSKNLIPLCHKCNNKKRTIRDAGDNRFLHAYFEEIPDDEMFFIATTSIVDGALMVDFAIQRTDNLSLRAYSMMRFQMGKVELNDRLKKEINIFLMPYSDILETVYSVREDAADVRAFLAKTVRTFTYNFGLNDWRTALLFSLSNNNDFCEGGFRTVLPSDGER
ncbi:HNH endonuclease [Aeromonas hydrophila]|uniref:HNH endonuclease n=1 Tax=Aeromonas hydrophila TaxID=644 RepID=UPI001F3E8904|nr:HNH endonuclease signature motif containing protein [Aeromonas hydrophila]BDC82656.1 HNH endonuclease [Aeromonas hydrophila]